MLESHPFLIVTLMLYCDNGRPLEFLNSFSDFHQMSLNPGDLGINFT